MRRSKFGFILAASATALAAAVVGAHGGVTVRGQGSPPSETASELLAALKAEGQVIYSRECASCHGGDGTGDGAGPALVANTNLSNKDLVLKRILGGTADGGMDPFGKVFTDRQIAAAATFVRNAWDNANGVVLEADVRPIREQMEKEKKK